MAEIKNNDTIGKTLMVVVVLCLVCSIVVAGSAVGLKSRQQEQRALDKQRNILAVAGLMNGEMSAEDVAQTFASRITPRLVDLNTGELLETEVGLMKGSGKLILTGKLGEVMQESARAAVSYLRSRADTFGIDPEFSEKYDLHIHVPEGAIPKDGPSAGITMATALVSALTRLPVRNDLAMTGEITLRGKVLPVGGIKDKALAAFRAGIHEVILPRENEKDLDDIPAEVRQLLRVHFVESMDEVLALSLVGELAWQHRNEGEFEATPPEPPPGSGSLAH